MLINKELFYQLLSLAIEGIEYQNSGEHWITVHPKGHEKGQHLLVEDGETNKQAIDRKFGDGDKSKSFTKSLTSMAEKLSKKEQHNMELKIESEMRKAAKDLDFEKAMQLRDILFEMRAKEN